MSSTLYIVSAITISILTSVSVYISTLSIPTKNALYTASMNMILLYSFGASLLLYGMALYFFSTFPQHAPRILLIVDILLIGIAWITLFLNPWKEQAHLYGASGLNPTSPSFLGAASALTALLLFAIYSLVSFRDMTNQLYMLITMNTLLIPFLFLSTQSTNSLLLNEFTGHF